MITIFNRKELCITFDFKEQARIRDVLTFNNIDFIIKTINRMSPSPMAASSRARTGTFGQDTSTMYEYKIYVHKNDYEEAVHLIRK